MPLHRHATPMVLVGDTCNSDGVVQTGSAPASADHGVKGAPAVDAGERVEEMGLYDELEKTRLGRRVDGGT